VESDDGWRRAEPDGVPECVDACRIRYRFDLERAAESVDDIEIAARRGDVFLSPPSAWLLRPEEGKGVRYRFDVETPAGVDFVTGVWPDPDEPRAFGGDAGYLWRAPYSAFGSFLEHRVELRRGNLDIALARDVDAKVVLPWLEGAARTVTDYFGRFPLPRALIVVLPQSGWRVHGTQMGGGGASIVLTVGDDADARSLARDWVAVHEMVHLAVPSMPRRHLWLTEGLATYVEPLARARRKQLGVLQVWRGMVWGMPHGLPEDGDRGLDRTPTWGRTYWGGALFAMLADIEIRKQTEGRRSLDDALRAVVERGGHNGVIWSIDRFFAVGDEATGTTVLADLYARMARAPHPVDLSALWRELGVVGRGQSLRFDDRAPLAHIRRALTR
ncbi:MAG TPA: hypothetical protein VFB62_19735, partial [Polyangiaceae bacterium]|nr:hypothetical protein [Polyangiaceae bacterium]